MKRPWVFLLTLLPTGLTPSSSPGQWPVQCRNSAEFYSADTIVVVKGSRALGMDSRLDDWFRWQAQMSDRRIVKDERDLSSRDTSSHLFFFGPVQSFTRLSEFLPSAASTTADGFNLGPYRFRDSLDVLSLYTSSSRRHFQIGNSFSAIQSLWSTFSDVSQYVVMQGHAIRHHGRLENDRFDETLHYDVECLRGDSLVSLETPYYLFRYSPDLYDTLSARAMSADEDQKVERILRTLELGVPARKISCYIYRDIEQKYRLSGTPGWGNPFPRAWENHTVGTPAVEHESVHILFDHEVGGDGVWTFWAEGIVGYYYAAVDSGSWRTAKISVTSHPDVPVRDLLLGHVDFFGNHGYAVSAHFAKFLIDSCGLDRFKRLCTYQNPEEGLLKVYGAPLDTLIGRWRAYAARNAVALGPERPVRFTIRPRVLPDSNGICIAGDHEALGNWDAAAVPLQKQPDGSWLGVFRFPEGMRVEYKITRGSWNREAVRGDGTIPSNSILDVIGEMNVEIVVERWKDQR